jgi:hypothetical protein
MTRARHAALTVGAGLIVATVVIVVFKAPIVPAAYGVLSAVAWMLIRKPQS